VTVILKILSRELRHQKTGPSKSGYDSGKHLILLLVLEPEITRTLSIGSESILFQNPKAEHSPGKTYTLITCDLLDLLDRNVSRYLLVDMA